MKNSYKLGLAAITASVALVGCGGGSSAGTPLVTPLVTGNLFNTYVEGATYVCSSGKTGTTDKMGTYTCNVGDTVEFFLGKYSIGSADAADGILDVETDLPNGGIVMQLLEGIDSASDGFITIPTDFNALDDVNATPGDTEFEQQVSDAGIKLEDATVVANNHAESLLKAYLGGKTVYTAAQDGYIDQWVFDANLTEANLTGMEGANKGISTIEETMLQDGGLQTYFGLLTLTEKTEDYLLFTYNTDQKIKFYLNEVTAKAAFGGYIVITEEKLSGKTFYSYEQDTNFDNVVLEEIYAKMTFSNGTVTRTEVVNVFNGDVIVESFTDTFNVPYTIIDGKIRAAVPAMDGDPSEYAWVTLLSETADSWLILDEGDNNQDGTIEWSSETTLYLSKPADYPDFTVSTTSVDTTTSTGTTTDGGTSTTPIDTTGNATPAELANNTSIAIYYNISQLAMSQMSEILHTTSLYTNQKEIVDAGNLSCSDLGDFVLLGSNDVSATAGYIGDSYVSQSDPNKLCDEITYVDTSLLFYGSYNYASSYTPNLSF